MTYDLVFEGGGAKGMAFVGACRELLGRGHAFGRLLGTSAGAITATLLAAGYTPEEMLAALCEKVNGKSVFAGFMGMPPPFTGDEIRAGELRRVLRAIDVRFVPDWLERRLDDKIAELVSANERFRHVLALVERGGWYAADAFVAWLAARLDAPRADGRPRGYSGLSLAQFHAATGVELSMVVSDTTDSALLVLNHRTAPDCPVVWAVRMSMSIPLLWDEVVWKESWGRYLERDVTGHVVVDGGLLSNFPIELFISDATYVQAVMGPKRDTPILGLLIDEKREVPPLAQGTKGLLFRVDIDAKDLRMVQRLMRLVDTATTAHDKMVTDAYEQLVVHLPAKGYGTTEFDMTDERRDALVAGGAGAMAEHLDATGVKALALAPASRVDRVALGLLGKDAREETQPIVGAAIDELGGGALDARVDLGAVRSGGTVKGLDLGTLHSQSSPTGTWERVPDWGKLESRGAGPRRSRAAPAASTSVDVKTVTGGQVVGTVQGDNNAIQIHDVERLTIVQGRVTRRRPGSKPPERLIEEKIRLDVALPKSAVVATAFDVVVAVKQPDSPPLAIADLEQVVSAAGNVFRKKQDDVVKYRVEVTGDGFEATPDHYDFMLRAGGDSPPIAFQVVATKPGKRTLIVNAYQADDSLAAQTRQMIEVALTVTPKPQPGPTKRTR